METPFFNAFFEVTIVREPAKSGQGGTQTDNLTDQQRQKEERAERRGEETKLAGLGGVLVIFFFSLVPLFSFPRSLSLRDLLMPTPVSKTRQRRRESHANPSSPEASHTGWVLLGLAQPHAD